MSWDVSDQRGFSRTGFARRLKGLTRQCPFAFRLQKAVQTIQPGPASEGNKVQGKPQVYQRPTLGELVPRETYKSPRRLVKFSGSDPIMFIVDGKEGIRLSDSREGSWPLKWQSA
ncbi:hypothetical protein BDM02DRAFT_3133528 [Thelephora ganbajun]|uniref:Uncharacterized protein n=1 Tax=Thelephora ganbajun TaxID=370292 RepID=A0ACB6YX15_THEGA|nr:hypothetical protein BDM02DRAFT_3133528 [Thelephora ganbajun]